MTRVRAITATVIGCALLAGCGGGGPNYAMDPTIRCLRAHGFSVSRPYLKHWAGKSDPTIETHITKPSGAYTQDFLSFTPSATKAKRGSDATEFGRMTMRNVVLDIEPEVRLYGLDVTVVQCLRSR